MTRERDGLLTLVLLVGLVVSEVGAGLLDDGTGSGMLSPLLSRNPGAAKPVIQKATRATTPIRIPTARPVLFLSGGGGVPQPC